MMNNPKGSSLQLQRRALLGFAWVQGLLLEALMLSARFPGALDPHPTRKVLCQKVSQVMADLCFGVVYIGGVYNVCPPFGKMSVHLPHRGILLVPDTDNLQLDEPFPGLKDSWAVCMCRAAHMCASCCTAMWITPAYV